MEHKRIIINNTDPKTWAKLVVYYKWFFALFITSLGIAMLVDMEIILGFMLVFLSVQIVPYKKVKIQIDRLYTTKQQSLIFTLTIISCLALFLISANFF